MLALSMSLVMPGLPALHSSAGSAVKILQIFRLEPSVVGRVQSGPSPSTLSASVLRISSERRGRFKTGEKKGHFNQIILRHIIRKGYLDNLTLTGYNEGKSETSLYKENAGQREGCLVKVQTLHTAITDRKLWRTTSRKS